MNKIIKLISIMFLLLLVVCDIESVQVVNEGYLTGAENAELYYRVMGSGEDTIVVIHGGPGAGMNSILPSVEPLAQKYVLIFYDQRGGGQSELPTDTTKLQAQYFVEDLEAVRKHFGLEQMNVIAHSFGSVLVAQYALKYAGHLRRLVFHGATGPRRSEAAKIYRVKAAASQDTTLSNRALELLLTLLKGTASDPVVTCREYEEVSKKLAINGGETVNNKGSTCHASPKAVRYYYRYTAQLTPGSFGNWDFTTGLEEVSAPLLVVYGKKDTLAIPSQREWVKAMPNSRLLLVLEAWKRAFSDNPEFVFPAIEEFFSGDWPKAAKPVFK